MWRLDEIRGDQELEPLLGYHWEIAGNELPEVSGIRLPAQYVQNLQIPIPSFEPLTVFSAGINRFFAGTRGLEQITISFYENYRVAVTRYLRAWANLVCDDRGFYGLPNGDGGYKKTMGVFLMSNTGSIKATCVLQGVWPIIHPNLQLDTTSEVVKIDVQFCVDSFFFSGD